MTDKPEADAPGTDGPSPEAAAVLAGLFAGGPANGLPLTAQGVSELLEASRDHVEQHARAELHTIHTVNGTPIPVLFKRDGSVEFIPVSTLDAYETGPTFRRGTAMMKTLDSFIDHIARFGDSDSAVFVNDDASNPTLTALLDYNRADQADDEGIREHGEYRFGKHRTGFAFPLSEEWKFRVAHNGQNNAMDMLTFSNFIEDRIGDIALVEDGVPDGVERFVELNGGAGMI